MTTTLAPRLPSSRAMPLPMPRPAPVIRATLPTKGRAASGDEPDVESTAEGTILGCLGVCAGSSRKNYDAGARGGVPVMGQSGGLAVLARQQQKQREKIGCGCVRSRRGLNNPIRLLSKIYKEKGKYGFIHSIFLISNTAPKKCPKETTPGAPYGSWGNERFRNAGL